MKRIAFILLSLVIAISFASCGKNNSSQTDSSGNSSPAAVTATPAEIEKKIADAIGADHYLCNTDIEESWLQNSIGLDLSKIESYVAKQNVISSVNPDTVIVLKVRDGYAAEAVNTLNTNFAQMVSYIRQYPFGTAKVLNGRIYQSGNYVIYVIAGASYEGEDTEEEAKLALTEYAKIDEAIKSIFGTLPENAAIVPEESESKGGLIVPDDDDTPIVGG